MKKFSAIIVALLGTLVLSAQGLYAKSYTPKTVPNVQVEDYRRFVSNPDGILSREAVYQIDTTLLRLKEQRIAQVAVVAVKSIGMFDEPREFATELFRHWGIGEKGRDNGLLVLLVLDDGAIEIEVGYGLEGTLPDALCKRIIERLMIPRFKDDDFDGGMIEGVGAIASVLSSTELPKSSPPRRTMTRSLGLPYSSARASSSSFSLWYCYTSTVVAPSARRALWCAPRTAWRLAKTPYRRSTRWLSSATSAGTLFGATRRMISPMVRAAAVPSLWAAEASDAVAEEVSAAALVAASAEEAVPEEGFRAVSNQLSASPLSSRVYKKDTREANWKLRI